MTPEAALSLRNRAIADHLGADWSDPSSGWNLIEDQPHQARLVRGGDRLDVRVADDGQLTVEHTPFQPLKLSGRFQAWLVLLALLVLALVLARLTGFIT